jgi:GNAT superfamily N-acetyltransferase
VQSCYVDEKTRSIADLCDYYGHGMLLTRINVPKASRGRGHARALLRRILEDADAFGVTLFLEISPSDGLGFAELEAWYKRNGFHEIRASGLYRRRPQKISG